MASRSRTLFKRKRTGKIIFVTMYREEMLFKKALEAGAKGYVLKDSATTDIISCLNAVAADQTIPARNLRPI